MSSTMRPPLPSADTIDRADFLSGRLSSEGLAEVEVRPDSEDNSTVAEDTEDEGINTGPTSLASSTSALDDSAGISTLDGAGGSPQNVSLTSRRGSIPIKLEKTDKRGRYILTANDPDIREILKRALAREKKDDSKQDKVNLRDLVFTPRFTAFDRQNASNSDSPFFGFFVLFWICVAGMIIKVAHKNWKDYGSILGRNEIMHLMFSRDVLILAITDGIMCASTVLGLAMQKAILAGYLRWDRSGWILQQLWQTAYIGAFVLWPFYRDWPWTHTIFVVLHGLVFLMKQHSYASYNGYLSVLYKRKVILERKLAQLASMKPIQSRAQSPDVSRVKTSALDLPSDQQLQHRRTRSLPSIVARVPSPSGKDLSRPSAELSAVAKAIESNEALDAEQLSLFSRVIRRELTALETELRGKCSITQNHYPNNLNLADFSMWTCFPTLVYELEYPREERINWAYVAEKTGATFGVSSMKGFSIRCVLIPLRSSLSCKSCLKPTSIP